MPIYPLKQDTSSDSLKLNALGWVGQDKNSRELMALRQKLKSHNGIQGLEIVDAEEIERAKKIFYRDGFVVVRNALDNEQLNYMRSGCDREIHQMISLDQDRTGNRGTHRYSFGGGSLTGSLFHHREWAMLLDLPTVTPILSAIYESSDYIARGCGGDFCLPGASDYQPLHSDMNDRRIFRDKQTGAELFTLGSFHDPRGILNYRDLPCPFICCNFLMVDFTSINGPVRQIPGTQHSHEPMPTLEEEPEWMRFSTLCPAPAGSVVIRDVRAWHGGTPNLSDEVRAMPNVEFYAPWFLEPLKTSMPRQIFDGLSDHGQRLCRYIVADPGQELATGYKSDLGGTPMVVNPRNKEYKK